MRHSPVNTCQNFCCFVIQIPFINQIGSLDHCSKSLLRRSHLRLGPRSNNHAWWSIGRDALLVFWSRVSGRLKVRVEKSQKTTGTKRSYCSQEILFQKRSLHRCSKKGILSNQRIIPEINVSALGRFPKKSNLATLPSILNGFQVLVLLELMTVEDKYSKRNREAQNWCC